MKRNSPTFLSTGEQVNGPRAQAITYRDRGVRNLDDLTLNRARFLATFTNRNCKCSNCNRRRSVLADLLLH
jgi:hypothetical protein